MRHAAAAVALAAALFLALPAEAAGFRHGDANPGLIERALSWLAGWMKPEAPKPGGWTNAVGKDGGAIDPNGRSTAAKTPCSAGVREDGGCLDPNG
jgi:hypothetical protein